MKGEEDDEGNGRIGSVGLHAVEQLPVEAAHRGEKVGVFAESREKTRRRRLMAEMLADENVEIGPDKAVGSAGALRLALAERLVERAQELLHQGLEQLSLGRKMIEQAALRNPGAGGDGVKGQVPRSGDPRQLLRGRRESSPVPPFWGRPGRLWRAGLT